MTKHGSRFAAMALASVLSASAIAQEQAPGTGGAPPKGGGLADRESTGTTVGTPPAAEGPTVPGQAPGRQIQRAQKPIPQEGPMRAGSFLVYPEMIMALSYDSNVFYTNLDKRSDWSTIFSPAIWAQSDWQQHAVNLYAAADLSYYRDFDSQDSEDWRMSAEGRYDLNPDSNLYGGVWWSRDHEDRESPDARNGLIPTPYYTFAGYGGYFRQMDQFSLRVGGRAEQLTFQNVPVIRGSGPDIIQNQFRDRWRYTGGVRGGYEFSPRLEGFIQLSLDYRRYDNTPDDFGPVIPVCPAGVPVAQCGFQRDSDGTRSYLGARFNLPRTLKAEVYAGYMVQDYRDPRLSSVHTPGFGANVLWNVREDTAVNFYLDRTIEESNIFKLVATPPPPNQFASSYINTFGGLTVTHRFLEKLSAYVNLSASRADYQGLDRRDDYWGAGVGAYYRVTKNFFWNIAYSYRSLDSTATDALGVPEDYTKNQVFFRLGFPLSN